MSKLYLTVLLALSVSLVAHAQWQSLHGPVGGNIESLENFDNVQYCGTNSGALFYREGNGQWKPIHQFSDAVYAIFRKDNYLWIGTQSSTWMLKMTGTGTVGDVVLVNEDISTWAFVASGEDLYFATNAGVLKAKYNDTNTLTNINNGLPPQGTAATAITFFDNKLYATVDGFKLENDEVIGVGGIYVSEDNGETWAADTIINNGMRSLYASGNTLLAGTYTGLFYKDATATEWTLSEDVGEYNGVIDITKFGDKYYAASFNGVYSSADAISWTQIVSPSLPLFVLFLDNYNGKISCGAYGLNESADGNTWTAVNSGLVASTINMILDNGTDLIISTTTNGMFSWSNGTWKEINNGLADPSGVLGLARDGNTLYACSGIGPYKSTDNGNSWLPIYGQPGEERFFERLVVQDHRLYGLNSLLGMSVSDDQGQTWIDLNEGLTSGRGGYELYSVYTDGTDVYVGAGYGIFKLDKQNSIWVDLSVGALPPGPKYSILKDGNKLIVTTSEFVAMTSDNGETWEQLSLEGINGFYYVAHNFIRTSDGLYYMVCTTYDEASESMITHVYRTESDHISWQPVDTNYPGDAYPNALAVRGDYLYMGTAGKGLYRHGTFDVIAGNEHVQDVYCLSQNHPNPARTTTVIEYVAPRNHRVVITDSQGTVAEISRGVLGEKDNYRLTLDVSKYASGIYLYYVETPLGKSETKKISVVR